MQQSQRPTSLDPATDEAGLIQGVELQDPNGDQPPAESREVLSREFMSGTLISAGILLATMVLLRNARKHSKRRAAEPDLTPAERLTEIRSTAAREGAHELQAARAAEVARHYATLIDNKIEHLEQVIQEAEDKIDQLERATQNTGILPPELMAAPEPSPAETAEPEPPIVQTPKPAVQEPPRTKSADPLNAKVFELADQGLSAVEIARQTGTHTGKIELILALRDARGIA